MRLIEGAGILATKSMSTLSYIIGNYGTAPKLDKPENYNMIKYDKTEKNKKIYEMIFTHYNKNTLHKYLGDFLVSIYKKEKADEQSIWISDASRLTYIICEIINKRTDWNVDKKGVKTTNYIIKPFVGYLLEMLNEYNEENALEKHLYENITKMKRRVKNLETSAKIIFYIKNNKMVPEILKYIAPYFHITKVNQYKEEIENQDKEEIVNQDKEEIENEDKEEIENETIDELNTDSSLEQNEDK